MEAAGKDNDPVEKAVRIYLATRHLVKFMGSDRFESLDTQTSFDFAREEIWKGG